MGVSIEVVLFDVGGVLVQLGGVEHFGQMIGEGDEAEIWHRWLHSPWVRRYERGRCTRHEFAVGMVEENDLAIGPDEFLDAFLSWPLGLLSGAESLVRELAEDVHASCLSNSNEAHWHEQRDAPVLKALFPDPFLSFELDLIKPDREMFEHVIEAVGCPARNILFLDDNVINVDGARTLGIDAQCVVGVGPARIILAERGLLRQRPAEEATL
jgi:HAD superfamily hydrolase (TIGR01509 family)